MLDNFDAKIQKKTIKKVKSCRSKLARKDLSKEQEFITLVKLVNVLQRVKK